MTNKEPLLPPMSGSGRVYLGNMRARLVDAPVPSAGQSAKSLRNQFWFALAVSIVGGGAAGLTMGENTGVRSAIEAGAKIDVATLAQALPWKLEVASAGSSPPDIALLLEDVRGLRAQIEQIRHTAETQRVGDRVKALESAQGVSLGAEQTLDRTTTALATRLNEIDARLARLERAGTDTTPTGAISRTEQALSTEKAGRRRAR